MRQREALVLVLIMAAFIIAGLALLPLPFTRDQGIYAYNGWRWLADDTLYLDTFGHKGPLLYIIYAAGLDLAGGAMWGVNLLDILARAATVGFAYLAAREITVRRASLMAAFFTALPLAGVFNSCWWNAQAETFMLVPLTASAWLCLRFQKKKSWPALALAGVIAAQAAMLKWSSISHAVFLYLWIVATSSRYLSRQQEMNPSSPLAKHGFAAGFLAAVGLWLAYLLATGSLFAMWQSAVVFNSFHARAAFADFNASTLALFFIRSIDVFSFMPLLIPALLLKNHAKRIDRGSAFVLIWLAVSLLQLFMQARFFLYHYLLIIPPFGIAAAVGLEKLEKRIEDRFSRKTATVTAGIVLAGLFLVFAQRYYSIAASYDTYAYLTNKIDRQTYWSRFSTDDASGKGDFNLLASSAAANYVRKNSGPSSKLLVFGYEPLVNYLSARPAPTRFEIDYPLTFKPRSVKARRCRDKFRKEFMNELKASPPVLIALVDNDKNAVEPMTSIRQAEEFDEFRSWLNSNYSQVEKIEDFRFYRLKGGQD